MCFKSLESVFKVFPEECHWIQLGWWEALSGVQGGVALAPSVALTSCPGTHPYNPGRLED